MSLNFGKILIRPQLIENSSEIPVFDEKTMCLQIPCSEFQELSCSKKNCEDLYNHWSERRENVVAELLSIANQLDAWEKGTNISTTVGSGVGVASGAAVIGGMILMPMVAVGGLVVGGAAAVSNLGTGILKMMNMKKQARIVREHLDVDQKLLNELKESIEKLEHIYHDILLGCTSHDENVSQASGSTSKSLVVSTLGMGTVAVGSVGARLALKESVVVSTNVMKGVAHAAAALAIAIDLLTIVYTARAMANGSRSDLAVKLRKTAEELEGERMELGREFVNRFALASGLEE